MQTWKQMKITSRSCSVYRTFCLFTALVVLNTTGSGASSDVAIILSSASTNVTIGSTVLIVCVGAATGDTNDTAASEPDVTWEFEGNTVQNGTSTKYFINKTSSYQNGVNFVVSILEICDIGFEKEGGYVCIASHEGVLDNTTISVTVLKGCPADNQSLPVIGNIEYEFSELNMSDPKDCPGIPGVKIDRFCGVDGRWSSVNYSECFQAIQLEQNIIEILNITTIESPVEAEEVANNLMQIINTATEIGEGESESPRLLNVTDTTIKTLAKSAETTVTEKVVEDVVSIVDNLSNWPKNVVQEKSSSIVNSFEALATNLTENMNFTSQTFTRDKVIFNAERRDVKDLAKNGTSVKFNTKKGVGPGDSLESDDDISSVSLPPSLFKTLRMKSSADNVGLVFTSYSNSILFPLDLNTSDTFIGSSVLGVTVVSDQPVQNLTEPVVIKFKVDPDILKNATAVQCVSWDFDTAGGRGNWTATGCKTSQSGDKFVECQCKHLTNFAILMQICSRTGGCSIPENVAKVLEAASIAGVILSIGGLIFTIITLSVLLLTKSRSSKERERESAVQYKFYIQLCIALLCMYIVFIVGIDQTEHYGGCVIVSVLIHYFTLVAVMWMTATCMFLFWIMVVNPFAKSKFNSYHMLLITILCWVVPLIPVVIPLAIDRDLVVALKTKQSRELQYCFIKDKYVFFIAFLAPLLILILMNLVMFIGITFVQLRYICCTRRQRRAGNETTWKSKFREDCITALKLWCILSLFGLTWLFGAFTVTRNAATVFSTLFVVFTSTQGFFIFVFLCLMSRDALKCYKEVIFGRLSGSYRSFESSRAVSSQATKSSSLQKTSLATQDMKMEYRGETKFASTEELTDMSHPYEPVTSTEPAKQDLTET